MDDRDSGRNHDRSHRDRDRDKDRRRSRSRDRKERHRSAEKSSRHRSRSRDRRRKSGSGSPQPRARKERKSGFDQAPPGGAEAIAVMGLMGGLPSGAPIIPGTGFGSGFSQAPPMMGMMPGIAAPSQQATRHARRVYVGGLPPTANEHNIATFFSHALQAVGGTTAGPGPCVVNVYINYEKKFAFVEFRTVEETSNAMALDGIMFEGVSVRVRRPNDYNPAAAAALGPSVPNANLNLAAIGLSMNSLGMGVLGPADAAERVFVGGLPYYLTDEQCRELLQSFGPIKSFDLVKDRETGNSKGYGFVVYADPGVTDLACAGLNGMRMGERTLTVRRATEVSKPDQNMGTMTMLPIGMAPPSSVAPSGMSIPPEATRILTLLEAVTVEELVNDEDYSDIMEDMRDECSKFGKVVKVTIPRPPGPGMPPPPGLGKVIVEFTEVEPCVKAQRSLHGRKFGGRVVVASYVSEEDYETGRL